MNKPADGIPTLIQEYRSRKTAIRARLAEFEGRPPESYFYELAYCLLTPQSSAEHADQVVRRLEELQFLEMGFDPEFILREKKHYIRFHATKAKRLLQARAEFGEIAAQLQRKTSPSESRDWLEGNVMGLGLKEATHFLRNIGLNGGLAILDRHILRNLKRFGVIRSIPRSLSRKKYFSIERKFHDFSAKIGIPLDELDLLFWSMETGEIRK